MYIISIIFLAMAVSLDSFLYGMIYEVSDIKITKVSLLLFALAGWATMILFGLMGMILGLLLPIFLAKLIGIILLLIWSLLISKDIITYKKGVIKVISRDGDYFYPLNRESSYINFSKLVYYPDLSDEKRDIKLLESLFLGVIMNLDGGIVMLVLGIIEGSIMLPSLIFIIICLNSYKLGNILVNKGFISK